MTYSAKGSPLFNALIVMTHLQGYGSWQQTMYEFKRFSNDRIQADVHYHSLLVF